MSDDFISHAATIIYSARLASIPNLAVVTPALLDKLAAHSVEGAKALSRALEEYAVHKAHEIPDRDPGETA